MNKILLSSLLLCPLAMSGYNVSTEPTHRTALIEEFTGIHCPNCPDGHKVATMLATLHPEEIYMVAIHAGSYANPYPMEPDFRIPVGETLHEHFDVPFYPSAVISRRPYADNLAISRTDWGAACRDVINEISPVNLWTSSSYDSQTRTLTLDVEGYLTSSMNDPRLNVFLLQSEILGPQSGGLLGFEYPHRHMLRARLTDNDMGDVIETKSEGEFFERSFTYVLPEEIGGTAVDPVNVELLVFVTDGEDDVCQVSSSRPDTSSLPQSLIAGYTESPFGISKNHAFDFFEVALQNNGGVPLTSADFDVTINGVTSVCSWEGEIPPHTNEIVRVPLNGLLKSTYDDELTSYVIRMMKANGEDVETASIRGSIQEVAEYPSEFSVIIKTDIDAADNTWRILDEEGNLIYDFGPYPNGEVAEYTETVKLDPGKIYCLEVFDAWGNGICHPNGSVKVVGSDGKQVTTYREIRNYGIRQFFKTVDSSGVEEVGLSSEPVNIEFFDVAGRRLNSYPGGIHIVRRTFNDGLVKIEKIIN